MRAFDRKVAAVLAAAAAATLFFAWLAYSVNHGGLAAFDLHVRTTVHSWASPNLTRAMRGITQLGSPAFLTLLGAIVAFRLYRIARLRAAWIMATATLGAEAFDQVLKWIFHRQRPEAFFGHSPLSYSFPSGHSVASCCFYGVLAALVAGQSKRLWRQVGIWLVAALVTLAIGCSRVYLGVHYPTDVLGGYAAAVVWVSLIWLSWRRLSAGKIGTPVE